MTMVDFGNNKDTLPNAKTAIIDSKSSHTTQVLPVQILPVLLTPSTQAGTSTSSTIVSSVKASSLERRLESWLLQNNIKYIREHELQGCIHIGQLYVDFYLPQYNIAIELDGQHHFMDKVVYGHLTEVAFDEKDAKTVTPTQTTVTELSLVVARDKSKNDYMIHNKIHLLRIAYTHMDKEYSKKGDTGLPYEKYVAKFIRCSIVASKNNKGSHSLKWFIGDEYSSCKSLSSIDLYLSFAQDSEDDLLTISDNGKLPLVLIEHQDPDE